MEVFFSGHVQGVGFRYTTKSVAMGFEITGIVRNLGDGRVQLVAEGERAELEAFRAATSDATALPAADGSPLRPRVRTFSR